MLTVQGVVDRVGPTLLRSVLTADDSPPVSDVVIAEPGRRTQLAAGDLVLGVSVGTGKEAAELVRHAGDRGAAAVLLKPPVTAQSTVLAAGRTAGVSLIEVRSGTGWAQLVWLLRTVLDAEADAAETGQDPADAGLGDLFRLADVVASVVDAPVTIEDANSRVLAYSARQDRTDPARVSTIMGRRVPDDVLARFRSRGVFRELSRGGNPIYVAAQQDGTLPRLIVPIRMGGELLGSMWAVVPDRVPDARAAAFADAGPVVALHLLRRRARVDAERRRSAERVRALLEGDGSVRVAAAELDLADVPHRVVAIDAAGRDSVGRDGLGRGGLGRDGPGRDGLGRGGLGRDGLGRDGLGRDSLGRDAAGRDAANRDAPGRDRTGRDATGRDGTGREAGGRDASGRQAGGHQATGRQAGGRQFAGRETAGRDAGGRQFAGRETAGRDAADRGEVDDVRIEGLRLALWERITSGIGRRPAVAELHGLLYAVVPDGPGEGGWDALRTALSGPSGEHALAAAGAPVPLAELPKSRAQAQETLGLLRAGLVPGGVADYTGTWAVLALHRLATVAMPAGVADVGPLPALRRHDDANSTDYMRTLYEWLRHPGDPRAAGQALRIHPNTLRYRMRKIGELTAVDLTDPDVRLALLVQLAALRWS
jgi:hypothetical protein